MASESLWVGVSTLWVSTFLYGIYTVLFCRCMYIFYASRHKPLRATLLLSAVLMFLLSTTSITIFLLQGATAYGNMALDLPKLQTAGAIVYVTNNLVADALLIYRCFVIWGTPWVTVAPLLLLVATMILGYSLQLKLFFILSLTMNLFVPALVAGRLWWIIRRIRVDNVTRRKGRNAMAIILESGLIYSLFVSIHMGFFHFADPRDQIIYAALSQVVGIVPTLIIVRVGLGVSTSASSNSNSTMVGSAPPVKGEMGMNNGNGTLQRAQTGDSVRTAVGVHVGVEGGQQVEKSGWDAETMV